MKPASRMAVCLLSAFAACSSAQSPSFRFSQPGAADQAEQEARGDRNARIAEDISTPCRDDLRNKKILLVIGAQGNTGPTLGDQDKFSPLYRAINDRLRALGLRTFTREEIRAQIRAAEMEAQLRNDEEALRTAAKRVGASFTLRGLVIADAMPNPMMMVNQVSVAMGFTLTGSNGRVISSVDVRDASFAGPDVAGTAFKLVNERADEVVAHLYGDYCRQAGISGKPRAPVR